MACRPCFRIRASACYISGAPARRLEHLGYALCLRFSPFMLCNLPSFPPLDSYCSSHARERFWPDPESARGVRSWLVPDSYVSLHDVIHWRPRRRVFEPTPLLRERTNLVTRRQLVQSSAQVDALRRFGQDPSSPVLVAGPVGVDQADVVRVEESRFGREVTKEGRE